MDKRRKKDARVVKVIEDGPDSGINAIGIWDATGLWPGTIYPILIRLEREGLLVSEKAPGKPLTWQLAPTSSDN